MIKKDSIKTTRGRRCGGAIALSWLLSISPTLAAQVQPTVHDVWSERDGLPSGTVSTLLQDADGYLWVGTSSHLARFDGHHFVEAERLCPELRKASYFRSSTRQGQRMWWGYMGGLVSYEGSDCQILGAREGLLHPYVYAVLPHPDGGVWLGIGGTGVYRWSAGLSLHPMYQAHPELPGKVQTLASGPADALWVGTDHGLLHLTPTEVTQLGAADGLPSSLVQALTWGRDGSLLIGTNNGLYRLPGLVPGAKAELQLPNADVTALLLDAHSTLWVGTSKGLFKSAPGKDDLWPTETTTRVGSLYEDDSGDVWVGTAEGLERYRRGLFTVLAEGESIFAIAPRSKGGLWAIDSVGGLSIVHEDKTIPVLPPGSIAGQGMLDLEEDQDGSLWIAARELLHVAEEGSLEGFRPPRGEISVLGPIYEGARLLATTDGQGKSRLYRFKDGVFVRHLPELTPQHVQRIALAKDGSLWLTSGGDGVFEITPQGEIRSFSTETGLPSNYARGLLLDERARIWVTTTAGLALIEDGRVHSFADELYMPIAAPMHLFADREGHLWINADDGLYRVSVESLNERAAGQNREIDVRRFTRSDGLRDLEISWRPSGAYISDDQRLWLAGPRGVSVLSTIGHHPEPSDNRIVLEEVESEGHTVDKGKAVRLSSGSDLQVRFTIPDLNASERLRFRYRLKGVDKAWIHTAGSRTASYSALPPGTHQLLVSARRMPGSWGKAQKLLEVTVLPRWHETAGARLLALFSLLSVLYGFHRLRLRHAQSREKQLADHVERKTQQLQAEVKERKRAEEQLLQLNAELDLRVKQRTQALSFAHEAVQMSEARFALAAKGAENAIWEWDAENDRLYCSSRWFEMLGLRKRDMTPDGWLNRVHPDDRKTVETLFTATDLSFRLEYRMKHEADRWVWVVCRGARTLDSRGNVLRAAGSQTDITKRKRFETELIHNARFDQLTGLPNRAHMLAHLGALKAEGDVSFAFFFFDLDRFKSVNDSLGHLSGDELLIQMSQRLKLAFESSGMVARLGGDEFALVLPEVTTQEEAAHAAATLHACIRAPFELRARLIYTTCSVGVCLSSQCETVSDFLRNADLAMYSAKRGGPGNTFFFSDQLAREAALRLELESDLRPAIDADEFELFFQPIISIAQGVTPRAEVLLRWRHPIRGLLSPGRFLPIVEEAGLSDLLTERVLVKTCKISKEWSDHGRAVDLSVNIPPALFMKPSFAQQLQRILSESGANPYLLSLELLETHSIEDVAQLNAQLQQTRRLGVKVYMDDFGSGYSSLSYLAELDIDGFKMDRRFLRDLLNEERAVKAYEAIMRLAHSLQMRVVAEGVERNSEFEILKRAGCEWFQGYLFSKPLCRRDFEQFSFAVDSQPPSYKAESA